MSFVLTRRRLLKALAVLGSMIVLAPRFVASQPVAPAPQTPVPPASPPTASRSTLRISVHSPNGEHLAQPVPVSIIGAGGTVDLHRTDGKLTYETKLEPGSYRLKVEAPGFAVVDYEIEVKPGVVAIPVYLGQKDWPAYRMGQSIVPFEPKEDRVAVAFSGKSGKDKLNDPAMRSDIDALGLELDPDVNWADSAAIGFYRAKAKIFSVDGGDKIIDKLVDLLAKVAPNQARIGMPIERTPKPKQKRLTILDNQYVVKFAQAFPPERIRDLARAHQAEAEPVQGLDNTWLFKFKDRANYRQHLKAAEALLEKKTELGVVYAEPNLIFSIQQHQCTNSAASSSCAAAPSPATNDPWSVCQTNLQLQGVPDAWCYLESKLGAAQRFGSMEVCVATVDCGINEAHPDIDLGRVKYISLCGDCDRKPDDPHGLAVLGIISAISGNAMAVSGVAPGVRHIAVQLPRDWNTPVWYAQMIVWLSGVEPHMSGFPDLDRAADIISASHGSATMATPSVVADAFAKVTQLGRRTSPAVPPRGTILVYSAGNASTDITGTEALAADPNVISVGNTLPADGAGLEVRVPDSNYGETLDLCAQGDGAPSLYVDPDTFLGGRAGNTCVPNASANGGFFFGGTSAACPMVAATAALMLTINKQLTSQQVREKLRATAQCIDPLNGNWQGGRSYKYGSGRLDVHRAVKAADASPGVG